VEIGTSTTRIQACGGVGIAAFAIESGRSRAIHGAYGIAIERILSAVVEQHCDRDGNRLPAAIAPFAVVLTPVFYADEGQRSAANAVYQACLAQGLDALLDDRDERPGVKFKDARSDWHSCANRGGQKTAQVELVERQTRTKTTWQSRMPPAWFTKLVVDLDAIPAGQAVVSLAIPPRHQHSANMASLMPALGRGGVEAMQ